MKEKIMQALRDMDPGWGVERAAGFIMQAIGGSALSRGHDMSTQAASTQGVPEDQCWKGTGEGFEVPRFMVLRFYDINDESGMAHVACIPVHEGASARHAVEEARADLNHMGHVAKRVLVVKVVADTELTLKVV